MQPDLRLKAESKNPLKPYSRTYTSHRLARSHVPFDKLDQHLLTPQSRLSDAGIIGFQRLGRFWGGFEYWREVSSSLQSKP